MLKKADLYDQDLYAWTQEQIALLQACCFDRLDISHLVEELQLMGGSERGELANRLIVLLTHLLKLHVAAQHLPMDLRSARVRAGTAPAARNACISPKPCGATRACAAPCLRNWLTPTRSPAWRPLGTSRLRRPPCPPGVHGGWSSSWIPTSGRRRRRHNERCSRAVVKRVSHRRNRSV